MNNDYSHIFILTCFLIAVIVLATHIHLWGKIDDIHIDPALKNYAPETSMYCKKVGYTIGLQNYYGQVCRDGYIVTDSGFSSLIPERYDQIVQPVVDSMLAEAQSEWRENNE